MASVETIVFVRPYKLLDRNVRNVVPLAAALEDTGATTLAMSDHVLMGEDTSGYPYGVFPHPVTMGWADPLIALTAMAAATSHIRLTTAVMLAPLRRAVNLAKMVATLDEVSGGRFELGVGTGWQRSEFDASGVKWDDRYRVFYDTLRVCRALWYDPQPVSLKTRTVSFERMWCIPRPQREIQLYLGVAATPGNLRRMAEHRAGWSPVGVTPAEIADAVAGLRAAYAEAGHDPRDVRVRAAIQWQGSDGKLDTGLVRASSEEFIEAGATGLVFDPTAAEATDVAGVARAVSQIVAAIA